jgi:hypothetical protein
MPSKILKVVLSLYKVNIDALNFEIQNLSLVLRFLSFRCQLANDNKRSTNNLVSKGSLLSSLSLQAKVDRLTLHWYLNNYHGASVCCNEQS